MRPVILCLECTHDNGHAV